RLIPVPARLALDFVLAHGPGRPADSDPVLAVLGPLIEDDLFHDAPNDLLALDHARHIPQFGKILTQRDNLSAVRRGKRYRLLAAPTLVFNVDGHNPTAESLFTQSVMQNPTGTDMSPHVALKVLQAAERHNFTVVE